VPTGDCEIRHFSIVELALEVGVGGVGVSVFAGQVCFLARKYGLTLREVSLIALISSGKSGRDISQTLGIRMSTIRQYCRTIHAKIGTHSRLAIGLWAIREGMVKSAVQSFTIPSTGPLSGASQHVLVTSCSIMSYDPRWITIMLSEVAAYVTVVVAHLHFRNQSRPAKCAAPDCASLPLPSRSTAATLRPSAPAAVIGDYFG
jgi:DNA-binding CsgD family transcriptional regulator